MLKYLIGIDVGGTNIKVMIMDTGLTVIGKRSFPTSAEDGYDMISDRIITNIDCMLAEKNIDYASFVVMEFITWDLAKLRNVQDWLRQSIIFPTM